MESADPASRMEVGVVVERRPTRSAWQDHVWVPVEVVPGGLPAEPWTLLREAGGATLYFAGMFSLEFFRKDTEGYRRNLSCDVPLVYVVLRRSEGPVAVQVFLVTVNPYEAESYMVSGEDTVEGVPMPAAVAIALGAYVLHHHVDEPFIKRRQKPKDPTLVRAGSRVGSERGGHGW